MVPAAPFPPLFISHPQDILHDINNIPTFPTFTFSPPVLKDQGIMIHAVCGRPSEIMQKLVSIRRRVRDRQKQRQGRHGGDRQTDRQGPLVTWGGSSELEEQTDV